MLIYIEAIISTSPLLLPNYCLITAYLRLKTAIWPRPDRDLYVLFKTPAEAANQKRFAAIAQIVARMKAEGPKKSRKQLWKIATKAYDAENQ